MAILNNVKVKKITEISEDHWEGFKSLTGCLRPFVPDCEYFLMFKEKEVRVVNCEFELGQRYYCESTVSTCTFGLDDGVLITYCGLANGVINIINSDTGEVRGLLGHTRRLTDLKQIFLYKLLSCSEDFTARIWEIHTCTLLHILEGHRGGILHCDYSPFTENFITTGRDCNIIIWKFSDSYPERLSTYHIPCLTLKSTFFLGDLFLTSTDDSLLIWKPLPNHSCIDLLKRFSISNPTFCISPTTLTVLFHSDSTTLTLSDFSQSKSFKFTEKIHSILPISPQAYLIILEN